jgi:hypothetical protein
VLLLSILLQGGMLTFLFLGHHSRSPDFDCCNMWAVFMCGLFLFSEFLYFLDWTTIDGDNPAWHRASLFVPCNIVMVLFIMWGAGTASMLSQAVGIRIFDASFADLTPFERFTFVLSSALFLSIAVLLLSIAWAHRNNLGQLYYLDGETGMDKTELQDWPIPVQNSYPMKGIIGSFARMLKIDSSRRAKKYLKRWILVATMLQVPFYGLLAATYASGNQSNLPIFFLVIGTVCVLLQLQYALAAVSGRRAKTRKWNRMNLFFPIGCLWIALAAYGFTMTSVFFKNQQGAELWESVIPQLSATEKVYFAFALVFGLASVVANVLLCILHRKGWCDGQRELVLMMKLLEKQKARLKQWESDPEAPNKNASKRVEPEPEKAVRFDGAPAPKKDDDAQSVVSISVNSSAAQRQVNRRDARGKLASIESIQEEAEEE